MLGEIAKRLDQSFPKGKKFCNRIRMLFGNGNLNGNEVGFSVVMIDRYNQGIDGSEVVNFRNIKGAGTCHTQLRKHSTIEY